MAVDLSMMGLKGVEAYDQHVLSQAQSNSIRLDTLAKQQAMDDAQKEQAIESAAMQNLSSIAKGRQGTGTAASTDSDSVTPTGDMLHTLATTLLGSGAPHRGMELLKLANETSKEENDLATAAITRRKTAAEADLAGADEVARYLGPVKNQAEYDQAVAYLDKSPALNDQQRAFLQDLPANFDPRVTAHLADHALSVKEQSQLALSQQTRDIQAANAASAESTRLAQLAHGNAVLAEQKRHNLMIEKNGKGAGDPTQEQVDQASTALINQIPEFAGLKISDPTVRAAGQDIAARRLQLLKDNPAMDGPTATARAILDTPKSDFSATTDPDTGETKPKYDNTGDKPETALPVPMVVDPATQKPIKVSDDPNSYEVGKYYKNAAGVVKKWTGKGWE